MTEQRLKQLLKQLHNGERQAFSEIYQEMKVPLFTVLVRLTGDRPLAEDLLQEVFLKIYQQPPQVEKPRAYLFRMARNLAVDALRKNQPTESLEEQEYLGRTYDSDMRLDLEHAFSMLTLQERQLVALHLSAGLTFREVAAIVERPLGTVLWQYQKAIGKLRMILGGGCL